MLIYVCLVGILQLWLDRYPDTGRYRNLEPLVAESRAETEAALFIVFFFLVGKGS